MPRNILITGASNGIGASLALRYAGEGANLALVGRDTERLAAVEARCRAAGAASVDLAAIDVRDRLALGAWISSFDIRLPVDVVVANAGMLIGVSSRHPVEDENASYRLFETNVLGVMNTLHPLIPAMTKRRSGQIGIVSSLAALTPLAHMPSYSASKACVLHYGQSLRALLHPYGVGVSVVCPGFIATQMTEQIQGTKPFMLSSDEAATRIVSALDKNRAVVAFPLLFGLFTRLGGWLPDRVRRIAARHFAAEVYPLDG